MGAAAVIYVGTVQIQCPACQLSMPATVTARIVDEVGDGQNATLECTPDMSHVYAHVWSHRDDAP